MMTFERDDVKMSTDGLSAGCTSPNQINTRCLMMQCMWAACAWLSVDHKLLNRLSAQTRKTQQSLNCCCSDKQTTAENLIDMMVQISWKNLDWFHVCQWRYLQTRLTVQVKHILNMNTEKKTLTFLCFTQVCISCDWVTSNQYKSVQDFLLHHTKMTFPLIL